MTPRRFHHAEFIDVDALLRLKKDQRITVCIPTLNEAETIGRIITTIATDLAPLVDEILVIDSGSTDATREIARTAGAQVHLSSDIAPELGSHRGKGENLWKALHIACGDVICYIDGDIANFHSGFVSGLVGPLLEHPEIDFVKAYYERPLAYSDGSESTGGGRVSEILIRPLVSLFYPELAGIFQPLAGEYAARRPLLETLSFPVGYGVEIAHLIDMSATENLGRLAQTDLVKRVHRNRGDAELGRMAFSLLQVVFRRLQRDGKISMITSLPDLFQTWKFEGSEPVALQERLPEPERGPVRPR